VIEMIEDMDWFTHNLKNNIPFGFARFNDGEMMGVDRVGSMVARGDQYVDVSLSNALKEALCHKQENYYIGIPCSLCYPYYNKLSRDLIGDYELITRAVVTTNRNWQKFIEDFPVAMSDRTLHWVGGKDQDTEPLKEMGLNIGRIARIPNKNSWSFYDKIEQQMPEHFQPGDVVGISLGPTARVLVRHWFEKYPEVTFIDMGSNFDPFTRNVWHNCHKGWKETGFNLTKRCEECN
tara:strand:- start:3544 stop:4248 length:705 start_codon:yes stop_codon:yes gene_type:complete